jgi:hypothetical protein
MGGPSTRPDFRDLATSDLIFFLLLIPIYIYIYMYVFENIFKNDVFINTPFL